MPDGKPTKAPIIIFGTMVTMSIITVAIVFITHARRTEPYLDTKRRRVKRVRRIPIEAGPVTPARLGSDAPTLDGGVLNNKPEDADGAQVP